MGQARPEEEHSDSALERRNCDRTTYSLRKTGGCKELAEIENALLPSSTSAH